MKKVDLICPINFSGYGVHGTNLALELAKKDFNFRIFPIGDIQAYPEDMDILKPYIAKNDLDSKNITVELWHETAILQSAQRKGMGTWIYYPVFEFPDFKDEFVADVLSKPDGYFAVTDWAKSALERTNKQVHLVPEGVSSLFQFKTSSESVFASPTFINIGKHEIRKNTYNTIKAFQFVKANLILMPFNSHAPITPLLEQLKQSAFIKQPNNIFIRTSLGYVEAEWYYNKTSLSNIYMINQHIDRKLYAALINTADYALFPFMAEGWNLPLLECMSVGLTPIIPENHAGRFPFLPLNNRNYYHIRRYSAATIESVLKTDYQKYYGHIRFDSLLHYVGYEEIVSAITNAIVNHAKVDRNILASIGNDFSWSKAADEFIKACNTI